MAFKYEATVQHGEDTTEYVNLGKDGVSVAEFEGKKILKVAPEALTKIAQAAFEEVEFCLRPAHTAKVAKILQDPEASDNDKFVALTMLKNACVAAKGILPFPPRASSRSARTPVRLFALPTRASRSGRVSTMPKRFLKVSTTLTPPRTFATVRLLRSRCTKKRTPVATSRLRLISTLKKAPR